MSLRTPGSILLVSCYELGHQPLGTALPLAFLERAGFSPAALDISVENFDSKRVALARFVAISIPMHTALRLGVRLAERVREINPNAWICFYGLYAALNADYLLEQGGDFCIGGECEAHLVALVETLETEPASTTHPPPFTPHHSPLITPIEGVIQRGQKARPFLHRLSFAVHSRIALPQLEKYARLEHQGDI